MHVVRSAIMADHLHPPVEFAEIVVSDDCVLDLSGAGR